MLAMERLVDARIETENQGSLCMCTMHNWWC